MPETLQRSSSQERLINFAAYLETNKPRMKEIVSELEKICEDTRERKEEVPRKTTLAAVGGGGAAATVAGFLFAPFTGGLSLLGAAGAVVVHDKITDKDTLEKVKNLVTEFCDLVEPLKDIYRERREMFEKLGRKVEEMLTYLPTLIDGLYVLFINFDKDSTVERLLEVTEQCRHILEELEELKKLEELEELERLVSGTLPSESNMAGTLWRCRSKDQLINFAAYLETNKPRMKRIVSELKKICEEVKKRKEEVPKKAKRAAVRAGGAVVATAASLLFAPFTGGLSLAVAGSATGTAVGVTVAGGAAAVGAAGAVVINDKITDKDTLEKVKVLVTEFCELVEPLKDVHIEKREMFEKLDRKVQEMLTLLPTLIVGLYVLFINFDKDSTVQRLLEVTEQCRHILEELEELERLVRLEDLKKL